MDETISHADSENQAEGVTISKAARKSKAILGAVVATAAIGGGTAAGIELTKSGPSQHETPVTLPENQVDIWTPTEVWNGAEVFPAGTVLEDNNLKPVDEIPQGMVGFAQHPEVVRDPNSQNSYARVKLGNKFFLIDLAVHRDGYKAYAYKNSNPDVNHKLSWSIPARSNGLYDERGKVQVQDKSIPADQIAVMTLLENNPQSLNDAISNAGLDSTAHGFPY